MARNPAYLHKKAKRGGVHTSVNTGGNLVRCSVSFDGVEQVYENIVNAHETAMNSVYRIASAEAKSIAAEAARRAIWVDRDARNAGVHARKSIVGFASRKMNDVKLVVKGGSGVYDVRRGGKRPYFHYLEAAMNKRFAVIKPTVRERTPMVIERVGHCLLRGR